MFNKLKSYFIFLFCFVLLTFLKIYFANNRVYNVYLSDILIVFMIYYFLKLFLDDHYVINLLATLSCMLVYCVLCYLFNYTLKIDVMILNLYFNHLITTKNFLAIVFASIGISFVDFLFLSFKKKSINILYISFVLFMVFFIYIALDEKIKIQNYEIDIKEKNNNLQGLKIVQISDLHCSNFDDHQFTLINLIKQLNPDFIVMTGDIADDRLPFRAIEDLLSGLKDLCPIYFVSGNHDLITQSNFDFHEKIKSYGVIYTDNVSNVFVYNNCKILIQGLEDPFFKRLKPDRASSVEILNNFKTNENFDLKILLSHRPELIDLFINFDYDVIFSGHAHGGQVIIPFVLNGLAAPNQGLFPKYAGGLYKLNEKSNLVVSRGLAINQFPRVFNPPEIVLISFE